MERLINSYKLIEIVKTEGITGEGYDWDLRIDEVLDMIERTPTVDAVPVVRGEWIRDMYIYGYSEEICSICNKSSTNGHITTKLPKCNFCPHCGADMRGE